MVVKLSISGFFNIHKTLIILKGFFSYATSLFQLLVSHKILKHVLIIAQEK